MNRYSIGILHDREVTSLADGKNSRDMLTLSLIEEYGNIEGVDVIPYGMTGIDWGADDPDIINKIPKCDFLVVRCYTASWIVQNIRKVAGVVGCKTVSFIEHPQVGFDYTVGFLRNLHPDLYIGYPLPFYAQGAEKSQKVVIDHVVDTDSDRRAEEYSKAFQKDGWQVLRLGKDLPVCRYNEYMDATDDAKLFIPTHAGSYEHSIIDMVSRDIDVLLYDRNILPREIVEDMRFDTFAGTDELIRKANMGIDTELLRMRTRRLTPFNEVVLRIHQYLITKCSNATI